MNLTTHNLQQVANHHLFGNTKDYFIKKTLKGSKEISRDLKYSTLSLRCCGSSDMTWACTISIATKSQMFIDDMSGVGSIWMKSRVYRTIFSAHF